MAGRLAAIRPGMKVLYLGEQAREVMALCGGLEAGEEYLQKPFGLKQFVTTVRDLIDGD